MNKNELIEKLKAGNLLGDIACQITGKDIDIVRFKDSCLNKNIKFGDMYSYAYSTIASFNGTIVGSAKVYLLASNNDLEILTHGRMKETLRKLGYRTINSRFGLHTQNLNRVIVASAAGGGLLIMETLFLDAIESAVLLTPSCYSLDPVTSSLANY